ncbi:magnesium transporter CorA family protein [Weissella paramesenteroides]|uniref:magnesium transporter CorA family protein n=1 Tax=Weissella paramesenteroides TaxID=1249 RepID=UPI00123A40FB|nr:magnesium transporter CorA family protein [Weissella paramesenteroides]KAA8445284.1 magnesium transporter CorA family protein [Weissella paramesenteroides]KAA8451862.1 magnesium transporter CorA family protein [Weissella paramesenteroides]KAA8455923.1 magnesium transporter CorA family protein [Weissella paramesenteroides]KAA8457284.1 magnesium transporter CorA family protein [Weissella paramesenteroides]KAA8459760.1 magnesium transporter CorA family protein [Weissella paramesenteroides]
MIKEQKLFSKFTVYQVSEMTPEDRVVLVDKHGIPNELIDYAIDPYESARMEYDDINRYNLMIFDIVTPTSNRATTEPISFLYTIDQSVLYLFTRKETNYAINHLMKLAETQLAQPIDLILGLTESLSSEFMKSILTINRKRLSIQSTIKSTKPTQPAINQLMSLQTDLIYLINSLQTDHALLTTLQMHDRQHLNTKQLERIDDVAVELQQALDTGKLSQEVTSSVANAFDNVANANLNWTMKLLTVSSIVLTMPTIVSGFFGQNVVLPFTHAAGGWLYTIIITIILMVIITMILWHFGFFKK